MDQPAAAALHRIGGAHHGEPRRLAAPRRARAAAARSAPATWAGRAAG